MTVECWTYHQNCVAWVSGCGLSTTLCRRSIGQDPAVSILSLNHCAMAGALLLTACLVPVNFSTNTSKFFGIVLQQKKRLKFLVKLHKNMCAVIITSGSNPSFSDIFPLHCLCQLKTTNTIQSSCCPRATRCMGMWEMSFGCGECREKGVLVGQMIPSPFYYRVK